MKPFIVTKDILNIRNSPSSDHDNTFIGNVLKGTVIFLNEEAVAGTIPEGATTSRWLGDTNNRFVHGEGVVEASWFWIKEYEIDKLWEQSTGENVTVILIDSGVKDCEDLTGANVNLSTVLSIGDSIDVHGHGTLMASIIAGNGNFIQGIAPNVNIISIKISDNGNFDEANFIKALKLLTKILEKKKSYVINCSLDLKLDLDEAVISEIQNIINELHEIYNVVFTAAVGNAPFTGFKTIPASLDNVVSCAGLRNENGQIVKLSSTYWENITINSPAEYPVNHLTRLFNDEVHPQGTSHACAFTSGLISLLISQGINKQKKIDSNDIVNILKTSSDTVMIDDETYQQLNKTKLLNSFNNI
jgi:subtilisin family serine protease